MRRGSVRILLLFLACAAASIVSLSRARTAESNAGDAVAASAEPGGALPERVTTRLPGGELLVTGAGAQMAREQGGPSDRIVVAPTEARQGHTATVLIDGRVLLLGGLPEHLPTTFYASLQPTHDVFYDPTSGVEMAAGWRLRPGRHGHSTTTLPYGRLLVAGGCNTTGALAHIEVLDAVTGAGLAWREGLRTPRCRHSATLLPDGRVLVLGGVDTHGRPLDSGEWLDPRKATVTPAKARLREARADHVATLIDDSHVIVSGGVQRARETIAVAARESSPAAVMATHPASDARASAATLVGLRFSQPMQTTSLEDGLSLWRNGEPVPGRAGWAEGGLYAFFVPSSRLLPGSYEVRLTSVLDLRDHSLPPFESRFIVEEHALPTRRLSSDLASTPLPQVNAAPLVNAGADQARPRPGRVALAAAASDDDLPNPPGALTLSWSVVSAPAGALVVFGGTGSGALDPTVTLDRPGNYVLRLTAHDGALATSDDVAVTVATPGDFDGDLRADVLWRDPVSTATELWKMQGGSTPGEPVSGTLSGAPIPASNWLVQGIGDFDGSGKADILWRNATSGALVQWFMDGFVRASALALPTQADLNWAVRAVADFNGDGKADVLWRHETSGAAEVWLTNGAATPLAGVPNLTWTIEAAGDFDGDSRADILWRNTVSGRRTLWFMNGATRLAAELLPVTSEGALLEGVADFDADGRADLLWRETNGLQVWLMDRSVPRAIGSPGAIASGWQIAALGDFNGDGRADILGREPISGAVVVWLMNGAARLVGAPLVATRTAAWSSQGAFNWAFGTLSPPTIAPASGTFTGAVTVAVTSSEGALLRYTQALAPGIPIDPSPSSPIVSGAISLDRSTNIKTRAYRDGWNASAVTSATLTVQVAAPIVELAPGTYASGQRVRVVSPTAGAVMHYTMNGATPSESDPSVASGAYLVVPNGTLKVKAWKVGCTESSVTTATYAVTTSASPRGQALFIAATTVQAGQEVLSNSNDQAVSARLTAMGFSIRPRSHTVDRNEAVAASLVLISSTVDAMQMRSGGYFLPNKDFSTVRKPVVCWQPLLYGALRMTGTTAGTDYGTTSAPQTQIAMEPASAGHALAAGLSGTVFVASVATPLAYGVPIASALKVAAPASPAGTHALFAYEAFADLVLMRAPDRRVALPAAGGILTADGWSLFEHAVDWATEKRVPMLFVRGDSPGAAASSHDDATERYLTGLGYAVVSKTSSQVLSEADPAAGTVFVVMSTSADIGSTFRNSPVAVVNANADLLDNLGMATAPHALATPQTYVGMQLAGHVLSAGLYDQPQLSNAATYWSATQGAAALVVARSIDAAAEPLLFGYEVGDAMPGLTAPNRRIAFPHVVIPATTGPVTDAYWALLAGAAKWAEQADLDGDGLSDGLEWWSGGNPADADSNDDGLLDGAAWQAGLSVTNMDMDGDGVANAVELTRGTDPQRADTDGDGCSDGVDLFPLNPALCALPGGAVAGAPVISLIEPPLAPVACVPTPCN